MSTSSQKGLINSKGGTASSSNGYVATTIVILHSLHDDDVGMFIIIVYVVSQKTISECYYIYHTESN